MLKTTLKIISLSLAIAVVSGCSNSESNESQTKMQVKTPYSWLEGDWQGDLSIHAMEESFPAELKYEKGKLNFFVKDYCQGEATFSSKQNNDGLFIECKDNNFKITPVDNNSNYYNKIDSLDNNSEFEIIYIEYNNKERFAGWLKKGFKNK